MAEKYLIVYSREAENSLRSCKNNNSELFKRVEKQIIKIIHEPNIGSFVLIYELYQNELRFIDFDHHDKIYKKFR